MIEWAIEKQLFSINSQLTLYFLPKDNKYKN